MAGRKVTDLRRISGTKARKEECVTRVNLFFYFHSTSILKGPEHSFLSSFKQSSSPSHSLGVSCISVDLSKVYMLTFQKSLNLHSCLAIREAFEYVILSLPVRRSRAPHVFFLRWAVQPAKDFSLPFDHEAPFLHMLPSTLLSMGERVGERDKLAKETERQRVIHCYYENWRHVWFIWSHQLLAVGVRTTTVEGQIIFKLKRYQLFQC